VPAAILDRILRLKRRKTSANKAPAATKSQLKSFVLPGGGTDASFASLGS
jgi:hypothetical protein